MKSRFSSCFEHDYKLPKGPKEAAQEHLVYQVSERWLTLGLALPLGKGVLGGWPSLFL